MEKFLIDHCTDLPRHINTLTQNKQFQIMQLTFTTVKFPLELLFRTAWKARGFSLKIKEMHNIGKFMLTPRHQAVQKLHHFALLLF